MSKFSQKDIASILYCHYLDNYCQDDFSFDEGKTRQEIEEHYESLALSNDQKEEIEKHIIVNEEEGTDYDVLNFKYDDMPDLFLQVTSLIDYKGHKVDGYKGNTQWADVGMFFVDYNDIEFDELKN